MWEILGYVAGGAVIGAVIFFVVLLVAFADGMGR